MVNSRAKGARGEREFCADVTQLGHPCERSAQRCGKPFLTNAGVADILFLNEGDPLQDFHFEVKRVEKLNISDAYQQASEDSKGEKTPVVAHRKNGETWKITLSLVDFLELIDKKSAPK